jgi:hypothetical protein
MQRLRSNIGSKIDEAGESEIPSGTAYRHITTAFPSSLQPQRKKNKKTNEPFDPARKSSPRPSEI